MKIDNSVKSSATRVGGAQSRPAGGATATGPQGKAGGTTQVDISAAGSAFQKGLEIASAAPAFDAQRVAEIRQAIADGRFQVNPEKIADGLIESVRDMLAGRHSAT